MKQANGKVPDPDFLVDDLLGHSVLLPADPADHTQS
jgi:hypothetical protein